LSGFATSGVIVVLAPVSNMNGFGELPSIEASIMM
jgi:hypothetical protein